MGTRTTHHLARGQAMLEVLVVAIAFLIPISLFAVDIFCCLAANSITDQYTKIAARAAASQPDQDNAQRAAEKAIEKFPKSEMLTDFKIDPVEYNPANPSQPGSQGTVRIKSTLSVKLPVPIPFLDTNPIFEARAVEPITALPPAPHSD